MSDIFTGTQIEFLKDTDTLSKHGIYTVHSDNNSVNSIIFTVWNNEDVTEISRNIILQLFKNKIEMVHILPIETETFDIGKENLKWKLMTGSILKTTMLQSKTINLYSGI